MTVGETILAMRVEYVKTEKHERSGDILERIRSEHLPIRWGWVRS